LLFQKHKTFHVEEQRRTQHYHVHEFNKCVFVKHSDIVSSFLVILTFYCANTAAFYISDWKNLEGGQ